MPKTKKVEKKINLEIFKEQQKCLFENTVFSNLAQPYQKTIDPYQAVFEKRGKELIAEGKVGCILVAGGQGTRLGFEGPKGCYPLTAVKHKTLFQLFSEKLQAASLKVGHPLKMAIMTSQDNHASIQAHFMANDYFGCSPFQINFFKQGELPFLDTKGDLIQQGNKVMSGPDGNGSSISAFFASPIAKEWEKEGITFINFILIDNPLADPFDPYLVGAHAINAVDASLKCIKREDIDEQLGLVVEVMSKPAVIEYMEAPRELWKDPEYLIANISLFCFSFSFLVEAAKQKLPLHKAFKKEVWKFERFIFDVLNYTHNAQVLLYPRKDCFAPLKNRTGKNSPETARAALTLKDREIIEAITGKMAPPSCLEIDPSFYYPTETLLTKWKGKEIPNSPYVES